MKKIILTDGFFKEVYKTCSVDYNTIAVSTWGLGIFINTTYIKRDELEEKINRKKANGYVEVK